MTDPIFSPHDGLPGTLPWVDPKPSLFLAMPPHGDDPTGRAIAYLGMVMWLKAGRTNLRPAANFGPWGYGTALANAVHDLRVYFGLPAGYDCTEAAIGPGGESTWDVVDFLWLWPA